MSDSQRISREDTRIGFEAIVKLQDAIRSAERRKIVLIGGSVRLLAEDWAQILAASGVADSIAKGNG